MIDSLTDSLADDSPYSDEHWLHFVQLHEDVGSSLQLDSIDEQLQDGGSNSLHDAHNSHEGGGI